MAVRARAYPRPMNPEPSFDWLAALEREAGLDAPSRWRQRCDALERIEREQAWGRLGQDGPARRAENVRVRLEAANRRQCAALAQAIAAGDGAAALWSAVAMAGGGAEPEGEGYDALDALAEGVLRLRAPRAQAAALAPDLVFYQPTPARHLFDALRRLALGPADTLVDLGSGLGQVPLLTAAATPARALGIELEPAYLPSARECARRLRLARASFLQGDARQADLGAGTVFYLYTPFLGPVLEAVLERLRGQAAQRPIRICTLGPCTAAFASLDWLRALGPVRPDRVAIFQAAPAGLG